MNRKRAIIQNLSTILLLLLLSTTVYAQSISWISSTEDNTWDQVTIKLQNKQEQPSVYAEVTEKVKLVTFRAWGATFNELGWDALNMLSNEQQETILEQLFSPDGDMRFTIGRIPMNANDYARDWYSCDDVDGDFELKYFNID